MCFLVLRSQCGSTFTRRLRCLVASSAYISNFTFGSGGAFTIVDPLVAMFRAYPPARIPVVFRPVIMHVASRWWFGLRMGVPVLGLSVMCLFFVISTPGPFLYASVTSTLGFPPPLFPFDVLPMGFGSFWGRSRPRPMIPPHLRDSCACWYTCGLFRVLCSRCFAGWRP